MTNQTYHARDKYFGKVASDYDAQRTQKPRWIREQGVVAQFIATIEPGGRVLDVPFGTGRFVEFYLERGLSVMGADISADMIAAAADRLGEETFQQLDVRVADAEQLPFDDAAVDVLVCTRFIKWLPNLGVIDKVIGQFARICSGHMLIQVKIATNGGPKVRGLLGLINHFPSWLRRKLRTGLTALSGQNEQKTRRYRDADIRAIFTRRGLEIIDFFDDEEESRGIRYYVLNNRNGSK